MMNKSRDIICLSLMDWESNFANSTVFLLKEVSLLHNVTYINYPYTLKDLFTMKLDILLRSLGIRYRIKRISNVNVLYLFPIFPINFLPSILYSFFLKINNKIINICVNNYIKKFKQTNITLINALIPQYDLNNRHIDQKVYYCFDEISAAEWCKEHGKQKEIEYIQRADKVFTTSKTLLTNKSKYNSNIILIPNAADFILFNRHFNLKIRKDIIGYVGSLDNRIDYTLLEYCIKRTPNIKWKFIGRVIENDCVNKLKLYSNTLFLEPVHIDKLPPIVNQFKIGIIPFKQNKFTQSIYPIKINEYLSLGLSVISTNFSNNLEEFATHIKTSNNKKEFLQYLLQELNSDIDHTRNINIAKQNTWKHRAEALNNFLFKV